MSRFARRIRPFVHAELQASRCAEYLGKVDLAFAHLERAHVLGQSATSEHVRAHWHMLCWSVRQHRPREAAGQLLRIVGAATKTALGWVPQGNTGGADVSPFRPMPIPPDLQRLIEKARS